MENVEIAATFEEVADLLEITGANPFRVRAYRNAARTIESHATPMRTLVAEHADLTELPAIGKDTAKYIGELVVKGRLSVLEELAEEVPRSLVELMRLPGLGPKRARKLWEEIGVETVADLRRAAEAGEVANLSGFGDKTQERILKGIAALEQRQGRLRLADADQIVAPLLAWLRADPAVDRVEVAGSMRRRLETIGDIDLLAIATNADAAMARFTSYGRVRTVEMAGPTRGTVVLDSGLQVDLRILPPDDYGAALQYFTGSKEHNVALRTRAVGMGLKVSEYGVFRDEERVAGATEDDVYAALDLPWMPPELRENRGEIEAAAGNRLPTLVALEDMRGDLQMHSTWSDGRQSLREMAEGCRAKGYAYMAITDHSKNLAMTGGLDAKRLKEQWVELDDVRSQVPELMIFRSMEVDILRDGSLDLEDELLAQLDLVLVSVHTLLDLPQAAQTARVLRALQHPSVHIFAHPTGRLINQRDPIQVDMDEIFACAAETGIALECNAHPNRLDLKDTHLQAAKERGIPIVISTDAHQVRELNLMRYGVEQARRGWLEPDDVLNTRTREAFTGWLAARRA
ncbi:MAG: DNA polymerase/3'-5' exonuclease PolX [Gemmatimonadales bacterium]